MGGRLPLGSIAIRKAADRISIGHSLNVSRPQTSNRLIFTLRIDKVGTLGSVRQFGTEIGVTVIPAGQTTGQLSMCQARYKPFQLSACERIDECVEKIAKRRSDLGHESHAMRLGVSVAIRLARLFWVPADLR